MTAKINTVDITFAAPCHNVSVLHLYLLFLLVYLYLITTRPN